MDELEISGKRHISSARAAKEHKYHSDYIGQLVRGGKVAGQKVGRAWYVDAESLAQYLGKEVPARGPVGNKVKAKFPAEESEARSVAEPKTDVRGLASDSAEESVAPVKEEIELEFALPFRKSGRQHTIAALDSETINKEEPKEDIKEEVVEDVAEEPAAPVTFTEEPAPEAETSEETFIPVKITATPREPEDSFYKVSSKGLRYIPGNKSAIPALAKRPVRVEESLRYEEDAPIAARVPHVKSRKSVGKFASAASLVLVAGIVSLGAGVLMSYYLHSITTIEGSGQTSTVLLSN